VRARPKVFVLTGGDPMMRPDLIDIVYGAAQRSLQAAMSPSATPRFVKADLCRFREVGLTSGPHWHSSPSVSGAKF
jgi:AdoMet-dependent heme synthase